MELTKEDLNVLLEAMVAWEQKETADDCLKLMLGTMLAPDKDRRDMVLQQAEARREATEGDRKRQAERSVSIRAKLLHMRDSLVAGKFLHETTGHS